MSDGSVAETGILVVGMHRTGTSALARICHLHGADLGADVTPPDEHNPRGYWENRAIVRMHDALLVALGARWSDLVPLPDGWRASAPARRFVDELRRRLPAMFEAEQSLLVKDPRMALFVPLWIEALQALGRRPVFVLTIRHPDEVAASLGQRDGLSLAWSRQLWLRHVLEAERATRGHPRVFVHYERLLADWRREHARITAALGIAANGGDDVARQIDSFLDPTLRHHRRGAAEDLPSPLREVYAQGCAAADGAHFDEGAGAAGLAAWEGFGAPVVTELVTRLAEERARLAGLVVTPGGEETRRRRADLRFSVDEPREGAAIEGRVRVCGWCFGAGGVSPPIRVRAGDTVVAATLGQHRPDVAAAFPDHDGITHTGFEIHLDLSAGCREVTVEAALGPGAWTPLAIRQVQVSDAAFTVCTIISKNYLAQARVLAESLARHHPDVRLHVLLTDRVDGRFDPDAEPFTVIPIAALAIPDLQRFCFQYSILELNTAAKPYFLEHLFAECGFRKVLYLDPDVMVFGSLQPIADLLDRHAIVLTPHLTEPYTDDARPCEVDLLRAGAYNLGFVALAAEPAALQLLDWWKQRLYTHCRADPDHGFFVDQKWIDLVPGLFDGVFISRDPGSNVAYWNLHSRTVTVRDGEVRVNGAPCRFFHFSGYDPAAPAIVSKHQDRFAMDGVGEARQLFLAYAQRLAHHGQQEISGWPYSWATFDSGEPISPADRAVYLELDDAAVVRNPFAAAVRAGVTSPRPFGVNVAGYFQSEKGVGEGSRAIVKALDAAGVPYVLNNLVDAGSANPDSRGWTFADANPYSINLVHVNADMVARFEAEHGPEYFRDRWNVGFWNWELDRFPAVWTRAFGPFDEIWTPSTSSQRSIAAASRVPVRCVPYAVDVPSEQNDHTRATLGLPEDAFLFLFAFDFHSVVERKNPLGAIRAFQRAFGKDGRVGLVVKSVHAADEPRAWRDLQWECAGWPNILLIDRVLDRAAMHALIQLCDAFVSLHRAEGFGFLMAEAMAMGKPTIATAYSSNLDFMSGANSLLVSHRPVVLDRDLGPYQRGWSWADPDVEHAALLMKGLFGDRAQARSLGDCARADITRTNAPARIGELIRARLIELSARAIESRVIQCERPKDSR